MRSSGGFEDQRDRGCSQLDCIGVSANEYFQVTGFEHTWPEDDGHVLPVFTGGLSHHSACPDKRSDETVRPSQRSAAEKGKAHFLGRLRRRIARRFHLLF